MKFKMRTLQFTAVFPPLLALLVGLGLFQRLKWEDAVGRDFRMAEVVMSASLDLTLRAREMDRPAGANGLSPWHDHYQELEMAVRGLSEGRPGDLAARLASDYKVLQGLVESIAAPTPATGGPAAAGGETRERRISAMTRRAHTLAAGAFRIAQNRYADAMTVQQRTDALIIVLSSVLAVAMALAGYGVVKGELLDRERIGETLRETDVRLSDAAVKLRRAGGLAAQQQRLRALELAARNSVHETRNLLTAILTNAELIKSPSEAWRGAVTVADLADLVERSGRRMQEATDRLEKFLHVAHGPGPVAMNSVVEETLSHARSEWKDRPAAVAIRLQTDLAPELPAVEADEADLSEALLNMVLNAVEAMPQGGVLRVRTQAQGDWVAVEVADTGAGMTEETRARCREPFFSTKGPGHAGVGLALVDSVVRRHQGTLDIESTAGEGTTVVLCLPQRPAEPRKIEDDIGTERITGLRVLVVDDESWSRLALARLLAAEGHSVETAASGREGLDKTRTGDFDVVITDRAMRDMSGGELAAAIKRNDPRKPVILATGFADGGGARPDDGQSSVDAVVNKPVALADLRKALLSVMRRQRA